MRRIKVQTRVWKRTVKRRFAEWDGAFSLPPESAYFEGWEEIPEFDFSARQFCPATAWWMAELCRTAYTPDRKELPRDRKNLLPHRENFLSARSPFVERVSIHKTGNHASIYGRADGEGGTIVCFRGTKKTRQWIMNTVIRPHGWRRFRLEGDSAEAYVHSGFYVFFKRIWPLLEVELKSLPRPWIFTGHSLGGALAMIASAVSEADLVCSFGSPKVGNAEFYGLRRATSVWRIVNHSDLVPRLPLPDSKLGVRQLTHGSGAIMLTEDGKIAESSSREQEDQLPFPLRTLANEFQTPPSWMQDHRMGEYCRKLRHLAANQGT